MTPDMQKALKVLVDYYTIDYGKGWFVICGDIPAYEWDDDKKALQPAWAIVRASLGLVTAPATEADSP